MSLPPELRVLCFQLSSTPVSDLPRLVPSLLRYVLRCQAALASPAGNAAKSDASASAVLVHKLKTQLSTLLNGKSPEGRFVAVTLVKAVVETGGWEVLHGSESWVRGLLSLLGKPDPVVSKELCIIALTKIYCMTHEYPTLLREITTPTLPTFVTSCLNFISNPPSKGSPVLSSLAEVIFQSFAVLLSRHTTIFRPFTSQIRLVTKPYLAPTVSDGLFVSSLAINSSRCLVVALHQTAAKNAGGEEWGKAVRELVKDIHVTADNVFRAVIEDWETASGYVSEIIDVNQTLHGGGKNTEDLPQWNGINAGVERLTGLLELLAEYFKNETSTPVTVPLGSILDMVTRMLSIGVPSSGSAPSQGSARLHPAIDRDERDCLWCGMPQIYVAALQLIVAIAERLQEGFMPLSQSILDQLAWVFPFGRRTPEFRLVTYVVVARVLRHAGQSLDRSQASKLSSIIRSCCKDLQPVDLNIETLGAVAADAGQKSQSQGKGITANQNADTFLQSRGGATVAVAVESEIEDTNLLIAARELLPLLLSCLPQQHLDISLRSLVERTAILSHSKDAMLASIVNPFIGKNGKAMASLLPHLTRKFSHDSVVEVLLRPRMPFLPSSSARLPTNDATNSESKDDDMRFDPTAVSAGGYQDQHVTPSQAHGISESLGLGLGVDIPVASSTPFQQPRSDTLLEHFPAGAQDSISMGQSTLQNVSAHDPTVFSKVNEDVTMGSVDESSDDESVHLTMQLDTESESD